MAILSEEFETPALLKLSEYLKMNSILASVTLLALANGAGDVLTSIASGGEEGDISLVLSILYGSGFFVQTIVFGLTIFSATKIVKLDRKDVIRDYSMLLFVNLYIILIGLFYKKITILISCSFFALYIIYVIIVIIQNSGKRKMHQSAIE